MKLIVLILCLTVGAAGQAYYDSGNATKLKSKPMVGTLTAGQTWCLASGGTYLEPCSASGSGYTSTTTGSTSTIDFTCTSGSVLCADFNYAALMTRANTWLGLNDFSGGRFRFPETTFASLPTASTVTGQVFRVTDCATAACTAGSGTVTSLRASDGTNWQTLGDGSGGTTVTVASPYVTIGSTVYLDGFPATAPPSSGWTKPSTTLFNTVMSDTYSTNGGMQLRPTGAGVSTTNWAAMYKSGGSYRYLRARVRINTIPSAGTAQCGIGAFTSGVGNVFTVLAKKHSTPDQNTVAAAWGTSSALGANGTSSENFVCGIGAPVWLDMDLGDPTTGTNITWRHSCDGQMWTSWNADANADYGDTWLASARSAFTYYGVVINEGSGTKQTACSVDSLSVSTTAPTP